MITIAAYDPLWPEQFRGAAAGLRAALGALALRIDHIGSTAVPGLAAKDRIDVQVTVGGLEEGVERALVRAGYERRVRVESDHLPPGASDPAEWKKWFFRPVAAVKPLNLHVRVAGRPNQRYPILFRDYLRSHGDAAQSYATLKIALARYHPDDIDAYCEIKDPACDLIMCAAEAWASATGWRMAASDA